MEVNAEDKARENKERREEERKRRKEKNKKEKEENKGVSVKRREGENEKNIYKRKSKFKLVRGSSKAAKYKINTQNSIVFLATVTTNQKTYFKKPISPPINKS